jgi:hypothetical protein
MNRNKYSLDSKYQAIFKAIIEFVGVDYMKVKVNKKNYVKASKTTKRNR